MAVRRGIKREREGLERGGEMREGAPGGMTVKEAGRKGGETVLHQRGPKFFSEIGKKGGQKVRELINAGKRGAGSR